MLRNYLLIGFRNLRLFISSMIAIVIALATAGYQALKAAWVDPADTLRSE